MPARAEMPASVQVFNRDGLVSTARWASTNELSIEYCEFLELVLVLYGSMNRVKLLVKSQGNLIHWMAIRASLF